MESKAFENQKDPLSVENKHEKVFCCGRKGASFMILTTVQFVFILTILSIAFKLCTIATAIEEVQDDASGLTVLIVILVLSLIIALYIWLGLVPDILTSYTLTTSVSIPTSDIPRSK
jgi:hypothetical protein